MRHLSWSNVTPVSVENLVIYSLNESLTKCDSFTSSAEELIVVHYFALILYRFQSHSLNCRFGSTLEFQLMKEVKWHANYLILIHVLLSV